MKIWSVKYAVKEFNELRDEWEEVIASMGLDVLVCMVRQHYMDVDRGWAFFEIGIEEILEPGLDGRGEYVFWGKMAEVRVKKDKQIRVIIDPETIDSIEFEIYDPRPDEA